MVDVLGPLGRPFTPPDQPAGCVLVGGGYGTAPLFFLAGSLGSLFIGDDPLANGDHGALLLLTRSVALAYYLPLVVVWAFRSGIDTLLVLDGRMRSEALDVEWGLAGRRARKESVR